MLRLSSDGLIRSQVPCLPYHAPPLSSPPFTYLHILTSCLLSPSRSSLRTMSVAGTVFPLEVWRMIHDFCIDWSFRCRMGLTSSGPRTHAATHRNVCGDPENRPMA